MFGYGLYDGDHHTTRAARQADADARHVGKVGAMIDGMAAKDARDRANMAMIRRRLLEDVARLEADVARQRELNDAHAREEARAAARIPGLEVALASARAKRRAHVAKVANDAVEEAARADAAAATVVALEATAAGMREGVAIATARVEAWMPGATERRARHEARRREAAAGVAATEGAIELLAGALRAVDPSHPLLGPAGDGAGPGHADVRRRAREEARAARALARSAAAARASGTSGVGA